MTTTGMSDALIASVRRIESMGDPAKLRTLLGTIPCAGYVRVPRKKHARRCRRRARVYAGDPRARGWLRFECDAGCWGDINATTHSISLERTFRPAPRPAKDGAP